MSWQDEARANGYVRAALISNNEAELNRNMQAADNAVDNADKILNGAANAVGNVVSGIGKALTEPAPPPKTSGGGLGGLLLVGALAGGAYLLSKAFGSSDDKKSSASSSNASNDTKKDANAYLSSGNDYYNKRQYELAIKDYTKAIILNPDSAIAYYNRGNAYQALGGNTANAKSDFARAKQLGYYG